MEARERLSAAMNAGTLVDPRATGAGFVDLVRVLAEQCGALSAGDSGEAAAVRDCVGTAEHLLFVVVDGLGTQILERLPQDAFLRTQHRCNLRAVFPSTTACAMTTLATAALPATHGIPGWWIFLEDISCSATVLPFVERYGGEGLDAQGVPLERLWPLPAWMASSDRLVQTVTSGGIVDSLFSCYQRGGQPGFGYQSSAEGMALTEARVRAMDAPSFTFAYFPQIDMLCHRVGWDHQDCLDLLKTFDGHLSRLRDALPSNVRMVVTADHGHMNVPTVRRHPLYAEDPLLSLLKAPPTGEPRGPVFHVRDGSHQAFVDIFNERFASDFALLSQADAAAMQLFGAEPLTAAAQQHFGDFFAVALTPSTLAYYPEGRSPSTAHTGYHAGLTPAEMWVPLIVA